MATDRLPPQNIDAELSVLGSLLIDPDAIIKIASFLRSDDFYRESHGLIYAAILRLFERREPADMVTVSDELERHEQLEQVGGEAYLTSLINRVPTSVHVEHYARIVEATALRRRLINAAGQIAALAHEEAEDVRTTIDEAERILFQVSERRLGQDLVALGRILSEYFDQIEYLYEHQGEVSGIPTGFADLDKLLSGLQPSDLIIVAGRPGMGKSSFTLSLAQHMAVERKACVAIFTLEMAAEQLAQRMISAETGIDSQRLRVGQIHDDEIERIARAIGLLSDTQIYIDDTPAISTLELRTKARRLATERELDLVIVDYMQLMRSGIRTENRVQEISYISRALKALARELMVPVIAASQLSRAVESRQDKRPILSDLRESGCLTGDTLITLAENGRRIPIRDLVGQTGFSIWALNEKTLKLEKACVARAFPTGTKPVYRLTTRLGRFIRTTANHKFRGFNGWKRLDELKAGDHIALPRFVPSSLAEPLTDAELALLGHLIGDGCTLPNHAIQYTTCENDLAEMVASLAVEVFGDDVEPRVQQELRWYQVYLASTRQHTHDVRSAVSEWLDELEIWGLRSHEKYVPERVFEQAPEAIALFLRHLWATDGCIRLRKSGRRFYPAVYYATSSERLAGDIQSLLLRFSINARVKRVAQRGKGRDQYHVIVSGKPDLEQFIHAIGAVGRYKTESLQEVEEYVTGLSANTNRDIIPNTIWREYVVPAMQQHGITTRQMQAKVGNAYCGTQLYKQNVSRERAARIAHAVKSAEVACLAQSDVYWDEIVSIEPDGMTEVYDLTVPGPHNFIANDLIVHNSIEQDADIVMFIYRDEMYNEHTDKKHIAEILVAKHRNGPTGKIELAFLEEQAKFVNLYRAPTPVEV